jgi:hypothetical protein
MHRDGARCPRFLADCYCLSRLESEILLHDVTAKGDVMDNISYRGEEIDATAWDQRRQRDEHRLAKMKPRVTQKMRPRKKKLIAVRGMCERRNRRY